MGEMRVTARTKQMLREQALFRVTWGHEMTTETNRERRLTKGSFDVPTLLAFFAIYVVWGTTFLAIRVAVEEMPPLLAAGLRFFVAGALLYGFTRLRRMAAPTRAEWRSLLVIALLMFAVDYGLLFSAERRVPSGVASVLLATVPLMTIVMEVFVLRRQAFRMSLLGPVVLGFAGTAVLLWPGSSGGGGLPVGPSVAILIGALAWAIGAVLQGRLRLPESKVTSSGATMLLGGGMLLGLSAVTGELRTMPHLSWRGVGAVAYLVVFGSILGFTAFVWLLARLSATVVSSHSYVNPVVAMLVGYLLGGERVNARMLVGAGVVLLSVVLVLGQRAAPVEERAAEETAAEEVAE